MSKNSYLVILLVVFLASVVGILASVSQKSLISVAAPGGDLVEGVIGTPRFVNPLLAESNVDRDLTALIYSGLVRLNSDGQWQPDLAQAYEMSPDGLVYTFTLRDDLSWHDGKPLTVDDIIFTIERAKRPSAGSPRRSLWENVEVEKADVHQIVFKLKQPTTNFLELASQGIIPKHLWSSVDDESFTYHQLNLTAVGSGPYRVDRVRTDSSNTPIAFELKSFKNFALGRPPINEVIIKFYSSEDDLRRAYEAGEVESWSGLSAQAAAELKTAGENIIELPSGRIFAIFFNTNQNNQLLSKRVRQALALSIDKEAIVDEVLHGFGETLDAPLPAHFLEELGLNKDKAKIDGTPAEIIEADGWTKDETTGFYEKGTNDNRETLRLSLSTSDTPELKRAAEMIRADWQELGAMVDLKIFELGALNQNVIRPREYEALFFGEMVGRNLDLYPFWHSSQRLDPLLNVALYANISVDQALEAARNSTDETVRREAYQTIVDNVLIDLPAVFVYSPRFIYLLPREIKTSGWFPPSVPSERFSTIHEWHIKTDRIWKFFAN